MKKIFMKCFLGAILPVLLCAGAAHSQTVTGTVTGTITDASGAVIPFFAFCSRWQSMHQPMVSGGWAERSPTRLSRSLDSR